MKHRVFAGAMILICLSILACGTVAFFTAEKTTHNVITSGNIDITLQEWADEEKTVPFPENGIHNIMPGTSVTKIVEVKNEGKNAAFVRVQVEKDLTLAESTVGQADPAMIKIDFDTANWTLGPDGYYYYNKELTAGEVTEPLFTYVELDRTMGNEYQKCQIAVDVTAYAVQTANNGSDPVTAKGWPAA